MFKFFNLPEHRKFNYIPRTYDPEKEKFENRDKENNNIATEEKEYTDSF
jgi:hypothetical protein